MTKIRNTLLTIIVSILGVAYLIGLGWGIYWIFTNLDTKNYWWQRVIAFLFGVAGSAAGVLIAGELRKTAEKEHLARILHIMEKHIAQMAEGRKFDSACSVRASELSSIIRYLDPEISLAVLQCADSLERIAGATAPDEKEHEHLTSLYDTFIAPAAAKLAKARNDLD